MNDSPPSEPPRVTCPHCGKRAPWRPDNPFRPFCSERCKLADLNAWLSEEHRIPGPQRDFDPEGDEP